MVKQAGDISRPPLHSSSVNVMRPCALRFSRFLSQNVINIPVDFLYFLNLVFERVKSLV